MRWENKMYDAITEKLIQSARPLTDLDLSNLPKQLTAAFTAITELRLRIANQPLDQDDKDLGDNINWLRHLANTYESISCLLETGSSEQKSCAFISATAHHLVHQASGITNPAAKSSPQAADGHLQTNAISSALAALLLFHIAAAVPDAHEVARAIRKNYVAGDTIADALIRSILLLAEGRPSEASTLPLPAFAISDEPSLQDATNALWEQLFLGVRQFSDEILRVNAPPHSEDYFLKVQQLSSEQILPPGTNALSTQPTFNPVDLQPNIYTTLSGPHHLATLLIHSSKNLRLLATTNTPTPSGTDPIGWSNYLSGAAKSRPFLWPNHVDAIKRGFLANGTSSAISFPTGAGKSTLVQLKIAATLLSQRDVLLLAPTHSLIEQFRTDLAAAFGEVLSNSLRTDQVSTDENDRVSQITICTPESCLAQISTGTSKLDHVGLIILDECHILHPTQGINDRRSLDAMLCLLNLFKLANKSDYVLISAMMENASELAAWIQERTGRPAIALDLAWRPTRQARGCVVYSKSDISALHTTIGEYRSKSTTKGPPAALQRALLARPYGLFCLRHSWTAAADDYALKPLLDSNVQLKASGLPSNPRKWHLTANRNQVAAKIATGFSKTNIKTMVLVQIPDHTKSLGEFAAGILGASKPSLQEGEQKLLDMAASELGDQAHVDGLISADVAIHHGLLLPVERKLSERYFSRPNGATVLVVSPTLSMGINLPAEAVIIAGDDRYEADQSTMRPLTAHELLNAAGRAGRATTGSHGIALVVPGTVVYTDKAKNEITQHWLEMQKNIFSKSDQCLTIADPIEQWLDAIQQYTVDTKLTADADYFLNRLPADPDSAASHINNSLSAFKARSAGTSKQYAAKVASLITIRTSRVPQGPANWQLDLSYATGLSFDLINQLAADISNLQDNWPSTPIDWTNWWIHWLQVDSGRTEALLGTDTSLRVLPKLTKGVDNPNSLPPICLLKNALDLWMSGEPLNKIELQLGTPINKLGYCTTARELVLRVIPTISYGLAIVARIRRVQIQDQAIPELDSALDSAAACLRDGFRAPEQRALQFLTKEESRISTHKLHQNINSLLSAAPPAETYKETIRRVSIAYRAWASLA
ncbi:DEAD/DEAH box helicase [Corallococcus sp. AB050B]|nr:DEAD/DEAH box helicase [Corallococcus sp. AB050B]